MYIGKSVFAVLKAASIPIAYGLLDSFPYKVELNMRIGEM
jgi:hypothetical protein